MSVYRFASIVAAQEKIMALVSRHIQFQCTFSDDTKEWVVAHPAGAQ